MTLQTHDWSELWKWQCTHCALFNEALSVSQSDGLCEVEVLLTFLVITRTPPPDTTGHTTVFLEQASPVKNT